MGLTKKGKDWYVAFRVINDGVTLKLAPYGSRSLPGVKVKRWKAGRYKDIAERLEAIKRVELEAGLPTKRSVEKSIEQARLANTTFAQWAKEYIQIAEVKALRSYDERCQQIVNGLIPHFGSLLLQNITVQDVENFRIELGKDQDGFAGRQLGTVNVYHAILKHMLKHAMRRDLLLRNVASLVAAPKPDNRRERVLTQDEWTRLYNAAPEWFKPVLLTGYHTGMRLQEILGLKWKEVNLDKGMIYLPAPRTKSNKARHVPLTPTLRNCLQTLRQSQAKTTLKFLARIGGYVFSKDGHRISATNKDQVFSSLCKDQHLDNFLFHDLRHCAVTNLADAGVAPEVIMKAVGHSDPNMFLRYRAVQPATLDAAVVQLDLHMTRKAT